MNDPHTQIAWRMLLIVVWDHVIVLGISCDYMYITMRRDMSLVDKKNMHT